MALDFRIILFQDFKKVVNDWNKKKNQLENTVKKMTENNRPSAEVLKAQQTLFDHLESEPSQKWMLDVRESFRDIIKDPQNFRAGELDMPSRYVIEGIWIINDIIAKFFVTLK